MDSDPPENSKGDGKDIELNAYQLSTVRRANLVTLLINFAKLHKEKDFNTEDLIRHACEQVDSFNIDKDI